MDRRCSSEPGEGGRGGGWGHPGVQQHSAGLRFQPGSIEPPRALRGHHTPFPAERASGAGVLFRMRLKNPEPNRSAGRRSDFPATWLAWGGDFPARSRVCVRRVAKPLPGLLLETIVSPANFTSGLETTFLMPSPAASGLTMRPRKPPSAEHVCGACGYTPRAPLASTAIYLSSLTLDPQQLFCPDLAKGAWGKGKSSRGLTPWEAPPTHTHTQLSIKLAAAIWEGKEQSILAGTSIQIEGRGESHQPFSPPPSPSLRCKNK